MPNSPLRDALSRRFGDAPEPPEGVAGADVLARLAAHRSHRAFRAEPVDEASLRPLRAVALSASSENDPRQRDIVLA